MWKVGLEGEIILGVDKMVASRRTYLAGGVDVSETLQEFTRLCALDVAHLWDAPPVVVEYLKTGDEELRNAAWAVAQYVQNTAWVAQDTAEAVARAVQNERLTAMLEKHLTS